MARVKQDPVEYGTQESCVCWQAAMALWFLWLLNRRIMRVWSKYRKVPSKRSQRSKRPSINFGLTSCIGVKLFLLAQDSPATSTHPPLPAILLLGQNFAHTHGCVHRISRSWSERLGTNISYSFPSNIHSMVRASSRYRSWSCDSTWSKISVPHWTSHSMLHLHLPLTLLKFNFVTIKRIHKTGVLRAKRQAVNLVREIELQGTHTHTHTRAARTHTHMNVQIHTQKDRQTDRQAHT